MTEGRYVPGHAYASISGRKIYQRHWDVPAFTTVSYARVAGLVYVAKTGDTALPPAFGRVYSFKADGFATASLAHD